jgi:hypothetical protein
VVHVVMWLTLQIVIFVFARVMLALARLSVHDPCKAIPLPTQALSLEMRQRIQANAWPVFASLSWAFVMYIFRWEPDSIQPSLRSSMKYMYVRGCEKWALLTLWLQICQFGPVGLIQEFSDTQYMRRGTGIWCYCKDIDNKNH